MSTNANVIKDRENGFTIQQLRKKYGISNKTIYKIFEAYNKKIFPAKINILGIKLPIDISLSQEELREKYGEKDSLAGMADPTEEKIYIANDIGKNQMKRVLAHEIVEMINIIGELELSNHSKIVHMENFIISLIANNPEFVALIQTLADGDN